MSVSGRAHPERLLALGAVFYLVLVLRWFDVGLARPSWLEALPPVLLLVPALGLIGAWLVLRRPALFGPPLAYRGVLWLSVGAALLFR
ncbi:MAG TPA: hypothetical protein VI589_02935, partial [Vicinamibacteria bacterium]